MLGYKTLAFGQIDMAQVDTKRPYVYHIYLPYIRLKTLTFIKAVSDSVFDMINTAYYDKPLIFIGL